MRLQVPQIKVGFDIVKILNPLDLKATDQSGLKTAERSSDQLGRPQEAMKGSLKGRSSIQTKNIDYSPQGSNKVN